MEFADLIIYACLLEFANMLFFIMLPLFAAFILYTTVGLFASSSETMPSTALSKVNLYFPSSVRSIVFRNALPITS